MSFPSAAFSARASRARICASGESGAEEHAGRRIASVNRRRPQARRVPRVDATIRSTAAPSICYVRILSNARQTCNEKLPSRGGADQPARPDPEVYPEDSRTRARTRTRAIVYGYVYASLRASECQGTQGAAEQTSTTAPPVFKNSDFCMRAATELRGSPWGSLPIRGGVFVVGGVGALLSQMISAEPSNG